MRRTQYSMRPVRSFIPILSIAACSSLILFATFYLSHGGRWRGIPQKIGLGDFIRPQPAKPYYNADGSAPPFNISEFVSGIPKPLGERYSRALVIAKTKKENSSWVDDEVTGWDKAVYVIDDPQAPLHTPKNKGHEAMVYFTYIIDNYDNLPDVMAFMHAHRTGWHNEEIFDFDALEMINHLSMERVTREGYMNMRCLLAPGCPDWLHPGMLQEDGQKKEEFLIAQAWSEIFPDIPVPQVLAQPCCGQFALSRERVLSIPRERYIYYRDWLLRTDIRDTMSGRIWEYLWHMVFTGETVHCPSANACLCDGFGICFDNDAQIDTYYQTMWRIRDAKDELKDWVQQDGILDEDARISLSLDEMEDAELAEGDSKGILLTAEVEEKTAELEKMKQEALKKGEQALWRAYSAGRKYHQGDGF
ncbi:hypothetical protein BGW36DRAFT_139297 [Talaromyces proteolyticus]|uniref:Uncharacterized protein n=1 Tax=Talaromyces proteolyticus TaxID=1131652 RepID=A0AAD4KVX5_9EURO|nr:uncharacterized protein BGW36DRAFT_139297 [Talaromyces proteolyticus]KAH8701004.1 hypothetical protein BGW36DRAFT_139297 [Talaromyces proteolyticus]